MVIFSFHDEDVGGTLKKGFHGIRYLLRQISHHCLAFGKVRKFAQNYISPFDDNPVSICNDAWMTHFKKIAMSILVE
jgi:hypothetical protein